MFLDLDKKAPDKMAMIDLAGRRRTYGEVTEFIRSWEKRFNGRNVAVILCHNDVPTVLMYLACMANRVVPLLISSQTDKESVLNFINIYHPAFVAGYGTDLSGIAWEWASSEEAVAGTGFIIARTGLLGYGLYSELSLLLTTSGSTGSPKLVRHSYRNLEEQAKNIAAFFELDGTERPMVSLPVMYTMGVSMINSHMYKGATLLLADDSLLSKPFWNFFREAGATSFTGVPYSFEVLHRIRMTRMDLPELNLLTQGGGRLAADLQKEFAEYIMAKGGRYIATYGQTEGSARMAYLPPEYALTKTGSIGRAIPNGKLYLKDDAGNVIEKPFVDGEMYYEGPNVTLGYAQKGEDLALGDERRGVLATGDLAHFDQDGMFYITGRLKRFLKLFGHRVSLDECENVLKNELGIECACIGNDKKLVVCITDEGKKEQVKTVLSERTELYSHVIDVVVLKEMPRSAAGKILYSELGVYVK